MKTVKTYTGGLQRTWGTLLRLLIENHKIMLAGIAGFVGFWFVVGLLLGVNNINISYEWPFFYYALSFLACSVLASMSFADFKSKQGRLSALMLPVSISEKFWPRLIFAFFLVIVPVIIGIFFFIGGNMFGALISNNDIKVLPSRFLLDIDSTWGLVVIILYFLFIQSFYFMGAILWPKYSFVKSTALFTMALAILITLVVTYLSNINIIIYSDVYFSKTFANIITSTILSLGIIAFCTIAYYKLKRTTII